ITRVDDSATRALEIDGKPAAERYADLLGVPVTELEFGKPRGFAVHPTALKVGREYFIRSPWKPLPDGSILFANLLEEGTELELMKMGDMAGLTRAFFQEELPRRVSNPQATLLFHCSGRMWYAGATGTVRQLAETLRHAPAAAGMNVHFEIYSGFHINTTLTVLAFGGN
ncbi:MAG TPA: FIST C-terminal domain-containing protein, partial [Archangium sp.]|nr:FIST C-terminal domain-containing protein [Archangium sp.]